MNYQICAKTVMDTSDPGITFDEDGISSHYWDFQTVVKPNWHPDESGRQILERRIEAIKMAGKGMDFDCLLGVSGGMDSSFMLHAMVREFGLRPLVFHTDGGWNDELAVHNIETLVNNLGVDLYTNVINWEEMRDFQLAWFKSGLPNIDVPQDHAFISSLDQFAEKYRIATVLNGGNIATECVRMPRLYYYFGTDMAQIRNVILKFGTVPMVTYPFTSFFNHSVYLPYLKGVKIFRPLNLLPYTQKLAMDLLVNEYGWKPYSQKHFESRFTRFYEGYWLPTRFGYDVRRNQFSSLILTGQMTREEALRKLEKPPYDQETIEQDFEYIATKLGIKSEELRRYHEMPKKYYWDYPNQHKLLWLIEKTATVFRIGRRGGAF